VRVCLHRVSDNACVCCDFMDNTSRVGDEEPAATVKRFGGAPCIVNTQWHKFETEAVKPHSCVPKSGLATSTDQEELLAFWVSICENAAASEVAVNLFLPYFLCDVHSGELRPPSDFILNTLVLLLNLVSAYLEGFTKSARLLTQPMRKSRANHQLVFILSHGFSIGFLNVSSSFPDVGGGGSDIALATGSVLAGTFFCAY